MATMAQAPTPWIYRIVRGVMRLALGFYFARIERFHAERALADGPVLFASNHPNSLTDGFVIACSMSRQVHFVATVEIFGSRAGAAFFRRCGVIPVNRLKDNPRAMRAALQTFESCFEVLKDGGAIAIFPEGVTHDDPQLKDVKTGSARMALEFEQRFRAGLRIVPVGLVFSAKQRYRSNALVHFGEAIRIDEYIDDYAAQRKPAIRALTADLQTRLESLILHVPELELSRVVDAVKRLYLDRLRMGNIIIQEPVSAQAENLLLTQAIADGVAYTFREHPQRGRRFRRRLERYESWLERLRLTDRDVADLEAGTLRRPVLQETAFAILGAPVAAYGWLHRLAPLAVIQWAVRRFAGREESQAQVSTTAIIAGLAGFTLFYSLYIAVFYQFAGWSWTVWYAVSLPLSGLVAHYYTQELGRLRGSFRVAAVLLGLRLGTAQRLRRQRAALLEEIESLRALYRATLTGDRPHGPDSS